MKHTRPHIEMYQKKCRTHRAYKNGIYMHIFKCILKYIHIIYYVKKVPRTIHIHVYIYIFVCARVHLKINPTILPVSHLKYKPSNEYHFTLHPSFVLAMPKKYHPNFNKAKRIMDIIIIIARVSSFQERVYRPTLPALLML